MSLLTSSPVSFTLSQLEHLAANYLLQSKNFGDHDREFANELLIDFLGYAKSADKVATGAPEANSHTLKTINTNTSIIGPQTGNSTSGFSSAGKILSKPTRATMIKSNKVVPVQNQNQVTARLVNYRYHCTNPAFGVLKEQKTAYGHEYLEVPNDHSAIYYQEYNFPSPLSDREIIVNIVWKRVSEKSIIIAYQPLLSHPKV
ncbi:hypothetical protein TrVE_jg9059 [Triparma verrucosa]|uniref:Uncharacterized protein n=1 Tax=Triparma verrucosa TaxID=1606542 RepID=A0A9W7BTC0_9STRA|nr:hypothetical protein TrVE_jg9059 [Triparma verrucosa]